MRDLARRKLLRGLLAAGLAAGLAGCGDEDAPYLEVKGGFIFNYRIAEARYSLAVEPRRELPPGSRIVATFEDPAGGAAIVVTQPTRPGQRRVAIESPPLAGIRKDQPYAVRVSLVGADGAAPIEVHEYAFRSNVAQSVLPDAPLTVGPGYARNPAAIRP